MDPQSTETLTVPPSVQEGEQKENPFAEFARQNTALSSANTTDVPSHAGSETQTPVAQSESLPPEVVAEQQMMAMRAQIDEAKKLARERGELSQENIAGVASYEAPTDLSPADKEEFEKRIQNLTPKQQKELFTAPEYPAVDPNQSSIEGAAPTMKPPKKGIWSFTSFDIDSVIKQWEEQGLLPKKTDPVLVKAGKIVLFPVKITGRLIKATLNGIKNWYAPNDNKENTSASTASTQTSSASPA